MLVAQHSTSAWGRPSPDPSGITYDPTTNQLIISDGEVEETPLYAGTNLFVSSLTGVQSASFPGGTSLPWSDEPTGVSYRPSNGHLYVSDDDADLISDLVPGADGRYGTADDTVTSFTTRSIGGDAEDVTIDMDVTNNGHLLVIDGVNKDIYDFGPGPNGVFDGRPPAGDDTVVTIDVGQYGAGDPEGIEYYPGRNTIIVLDDASGMIYELNRQGGLLNTVSIAAAAPRKAAGITLAPASNGSGAQNFYIVDRGVDNDSNPSENDGRFYEMSVTLPPLAGGPNTGAGAERRPGSHRHPAERGDAGRHHQRRRPAQPARNGDGGLVEGQWSRRRDLRAARTLPRPPRRSARPGSYVLRLTGNDGQLQASDDVSVVVGVTDPGPGGSAVLDVPVRAGADDAEERSASTSVTSGDLNLVVDAHHGADRGHALHRGDRPARCDRDQRVRAVPGRRGDDGGGEPDGRRAGRGQPAGLHHGVEEHLLEAADDGAVGVGSRRLADSRARGTAQRTAEPGAGRPGDRLADRLGRAATRWSWW